MKQNNLKIKKTPQTKEMEKKRFRL